MAKNKYRNVNNTTSESRTLVMYYCLCWGKYTLQTHLIIEVLSLVMDKNKKREYF